MLVKAVLGLIFIMPWMGLAAAADSTGTASIPAALAPMSPTVSPSTVPSPAPAVSDPKSTGPVVSDKKTSDSVTPATPAIKPVIKAQVPADTAKTPAKATAPSKAIASPPVSSPAESTALDTSKAPAATAPTPITDKTADKTGVPASGVSTPSIPASLDTPAGAAIPIPIPVASGTTKSHKGNAPLVDTKTNTDPNKILHSTSGHLDDADISLKTVRIEPKVQIKSPSDIVKISIDVIRPFLRTSLILDSKEQFSSAPYVVVEEEAKAMSTTGGTVYVRGSKDSEEFTQQIYKAGKTYEHPVTHEVLGFEALAIATAELSKPGKLAEFKIVSFTEPVSVGDRLFPSYASVLPTHLKIKPVKTLAQEGYILSVREAVDQIGANNVVVISLGQRDGIEEGNYLDIYQIGKSVEDSITLDWRKREMIKLPDDRVGRVLVFQTYDKISLALVLEANKIVGLLDRVRCP